METEGSLPWSQKPVTGPYPEPDFIFRFLKIPPIPRPRLTFLNQLVSYSQELLAPRPHLKLEDHPFLDVSACLFNIFAN